MTILTELSLSRRSALGFVIIGIFWGTFAASVPVIKVRLDVNDVTFGLVLLGNAAGLLGAMWLAPLVDKRLKDRSLQISVVALGSAMLLPALITNPLVFFFGMMLIGTSSGLTDVLANARVSELEARYDTSLMNANHGSFSISYAVAAVLTGLAREAGLSSSAIFLAASFVVFVIASQMRMATVEEGSETQGRGPYPYRTILLCGLIVLIAFMTEATVETWSALHIERTLAGGAAEGALGPAMLGFTMAIGRFGGQALSARFQDAHVIYVGSVLTAIGALTASVAQAPSWAYLGFGILGLGVSVIGPLGLAQVGRRVHPSRRTDAIAKAAIILAAVYIQQARKE